MPLLNVRPMMKSHIKSVMAIDKDSYETPWSRDNWGMAMREKSMYGRVAIVKGTVVGFVVFYVGRDRIEIVRLAVSPMDRRRGIGSKLVQCVLSKCNRSRAVTLAVSSDSIDPQSFIRAIGFKATGMIRNWCNSGHDAFIFSMQQVRREAE